MDVNETRHHETEVEDETEGIENKGFETKTEI